MISLEKAVNIYEKGQKQKPFFEKTKKNIREIYVRLSQAYHSDINNVADEDMVKINLAYEKAKKGDVEELKSLYEKYIKERNCRVDIHG